MEPKNKIYELRWGDVVINGSLEGLRQKAKKLNTDWAIYECKKSSMKKTRFITIRDMKEIKRMFDCEIPIRNIADRFQIAQYKVRKVINSKTFEPL